MVWFGLVWFLKVNLYVYHVPISETADYEESGRFYRYIKRSILLLGAARIMLLV